MVLLLHHGELRMALHSAAAACSLCPIPEWRGRTRRSFAMSIPATFRPIRASFHASLSSSSNSSSQTPSSLPSALPTITSNETSAAALTGDKKPAVCTADELHYVAVPGTEWRLALWRYTPCPKAPPRNHPLVLLSGVGTNAIGFDLSPGASFARHMSSQGFDTWIVEVRGAGLSKRVKSKVIEKLQNGSVTSDLVGSIDKSKVSEQLQNGSVINKEYKSSALSKSQQPIVNGSLSLGTSNGKTNQIEALKSSDEPQLVTMLTDTLMRLTERLSGYLSEGQLKAVSDNFFNRISELLEEADLSERFNEIQGRILALLEARQNSIASSQIRELSQRLINIIDEGQRSVSPQLFDLQERFATTIEDFQKQIDLIITYDWDFDHYLEEDIPAAMEYIKNHTQPKDGKLLAVGHSMGGILLYAMLSRCGFEGRESGLAAVVTLASSVDYTSSNSSLKLLLPLADPAEVLNVPVIPLGALLAAAHPLSSRPPYVLSWLNSQISAQDMMHPELLEKLVLNNFCTIPAKLLLHLTTAFRDGGLRDRSGKFFYKDHLRKCTVPVLALGGDQDLICPPEAVYETVKLIPQHMVTYKLLGKPDGPHYGHYDLVGCRLANSEAYPCIVEFLSRHDSDSYCGSIN